LSMFTKLCGTWQPIVVELFCTVITLSLAGLLLATFRLKFIDFLM
jgi:hypothetical protein